MSSKTYLLLFIIFLNPIQALACGTWIFEDLESEKNIRFKISGIELVNHSGPDPEFMQASRETAFFSQGDRLRLKKDDLRFSRYVGVLKDGR